MEELHSRKRGFEDKATRCYLTLKCSNSCSYCSAGIQNITDVMREKFIPAEKWLEGIKRRWEARKAPAILAGGEPFLYPDFMKLLRMIPKNIKVEIYSNIQDIPEEFYKIDRKFIILASCHENYGRKWLKNARRLISEGHAVRFHVVKVGDWQTRVNIIKDNFPDNRVSGCDDQRSGARSKLENATEKVLCKAGNTFYGPDGLRYHCITRMGQGMFADPIEDITWMDEVERTEINCNMFGKCVGCDNNIDGAVYEVNEPQSMKKAYETLGPERDLITEVTTNLMSDDEIKKMKVIQGGSRVGKLVPIKEPTKKSITFFFNGEFGWEILFAAYCRKISRDYKECYVVTSLSSLFLYEDFAKNGTTEDGIHRTEDTVHWEKDKVYPMDKYEFKTYLPHPEMGEKRYDIAIHARNAHYAFKNYSKENWVKLIEMLRQAGYSICTFGSYKSFNFREMGIDHYNIKTSIEAIHKSRLIIGPNSGPIHLAQYCKKPVISWTSDQKLVDGRTVKERLTTHNPWNPFFLDSAVLRHAIVLDEDNWQPEPEKILSSITNFMKLDKPDAQKKLEVVVEEPEERKPLPPKPIIIKFSEGNRSLAEIIKKAISSKSFMITFSFDAGVSKIDHEVIVSDNFDKRNVITCLEHIINKHLGDEGLGEWK